jgi:hypothetical protein
MPALEKESSSSTRPDIWRISSCRSPTTSRCSGFGAMFENAETELHARDGRAQFMSDVAEEAFLPVDKAGQASCHAIDASGEEAKLVAPVFREAVVEVSFGDALGDAVETRNGAGESANEGKPAHYEDGDDGAGDDEPQLVVEEQGSAEEGWRGDQDEPGNVVIDAGGANGNARAHPVHGRIAGRDLESGAGLSTAYWRRRRRTIGIRRGIGTRSAVVVALARGRWIGAARRRSGTAGRRPTHLLQDWFRNVHRRPG